MEVCSELQASVFEKNGYTRVEAEEVVNEPQVSEEPKRRRRRTKAETAEEA